MNAGYVHDALDRRVSKSVGGVVTRFVHAGSDEIAEYTENGTLLRRGACPRARQSRDPGVPLVVGLMSGL